MWDVGLHRVLVVIEGLTPSGPGLRREGLFLLMFFEGERFTLKKDVTTCSILLASFLQGVQELNT